MSLVLDCLLKREEQESRYSATKRPMTPKKAALSNVESSFDEWRPAAFCRPGSPDVEAPAAAPVGTAVAVTGALTTIRLVLVWMLPLASVYVNRCVDVLLVNETPTADEVLVTTPPPSVLKTTPPGTVETATSPGFVEGATSIVVGLGTVEAVIWDATASDTVAATGSTLVELGATAPPPAAVVPAASVVVPFVCRFAIYTSLLAITGFVECTCSIAARS